jgi:hypothetical protein
MEDESCVRDRACGRRPRGSRLPHRRNHSPIKCKGCATYVNQFGWAKPGRAVHGAGGVGCAAGTGCPLWRETAAQMVLTGDPYNLKCLEETVLLPPCCLRSHPVAFGSLNCSSAPEVRKRSNRHVKATVGADSIPEITRGNPGLPGLTARPALVSSTSPCAPFAGDDGYQRNFNQPTPRAFDLYAAQSGEVRGRAANWTPADGSCGRVGFPTPGATSRTLPPPPPTDAAAASIGRPASAGTPSVFPLG